jgi:hypothetical protein
MIYHRHFYLRVSAHDLYSLSRTTPYWKLKLYQLIGKLIGKAFHQDKHLALFKHFKKANVILIIFIPFVFALQ